MEKHLQVFRDEALGEVGACCGIWNVPTSNDEVTCPVCISLIDEAPSRSRFMARELEAMKVAFTKMTRLAVPTENLELWKVWREGLSISQGIKVAERIRGEQAHSIDPAVLQAREDTRKMLDAEKAKLFELKKKMMAMMDSSSMKAEGADDAEDRSGVAGQEPKQAGDRPAG